MKTLIFSVLFLISADTFAWYPYGPGMGWGMGWGMGYNYMPFIPAPSFNYTTVIQQSPPIIVNNNDQPRVIERIVEQPPRVIYKDRYCDKRCFENQYSK